MNDGNERSGSTSGRSPAVEDTGIRSVLRALDLLALFTEQRSHWTVRELTVASGLAKTTVVRLVHTLEQRGMLWSSGGQVVAGPGLLRWAALARSQWRLPPSAHRVMSDLSRKSGETVNLYVRAHTSRVCVAQQEGTRNLRHVVRVGDELPLWAGAAGAVLLTEADDALLERVAATSPRGLELLDELRSRIATARQAGYAVSHGERELGASGVCAPVFDGGGHVLAALGVGGPTARFTPERVATLSTAVIAAARSMSRLDLGESMSGADG